MLLVIGLKGLHALWTPLEIPSDLPVFVQQRVVPHRRSAQPPAWFAYGLGSRKQI